MRQQTAELEKSGEGGAFRLMMVKTAGERFCGDEVDESLKKAGSGFP